MAVFLIDPTTQTIRDVWQELSRRMQAGEELFEVVRDLIGCQQVAMVGLAGDRLALALDNFALLKRDSAFWRFADGETKLAGRGLLFAVNPDTGYLAPVIPEALPDFSHLVIWQPGVHLLRIVEQIVVEPGRAPQIARIPVFSDDPEPRILGEIAAAREAEHEALPEPEPQETAHAEPETQPERYDFRFGDAVPSGRRDN